MAQLRPPWTLKPVILLGIWLLTACAVSPELDRMLVCHVSSQDDKKRIEFYSYKRKILYPVVSAPIQTEPGREVVFRSGKKTKTLFPSEDVEEYFLSTKICRDSRIIGETIYIYPLRTALMGTPNAIAVSEDGGKRFDLRPRPHDEHPPVIVDPDGYLFSIAWYDKTIQFVSDKDVLLEQTVSLRTQSPYACPECPPVMWRRFQTSDAGKTWKLLEYKILRPDLLPSDAKILYKVVTLKVDTKRDHPRNIQVMDMESR
jgi:hypothetical protein